MFRKVSFFSAFLLVAIGLSLSSCDLFKPAKASEKEKVYEDDELEDIQGKRVFDPVTGTWRIVHEVTEKVDTVQWTILPEDKYPPITSDGSWDAIDPNNTSTTNPGGIAGTQEVVVMLPFFANKLTGDFIDDNSSWALHFYAGARLAYDELSTEGAKLHISVFDTEGSEAKVRNLLRRVELEKADVIIGPYKRDNVVICEAYAKEHETPLVVPHTASMGIPEGNPWYVQVNPSLQSHCEAIVKHARSRYSPENMVLVSLEREAASGSFEFFQKANLSLNNFGDTTRLKEVRIDNDPSKFNDIDLSDYIKAGEPNVFLVPSWSSEAFVYSLLRHLMEFQTQGEEIIVYGMPQWMGFEQVDYEFFERLQVHVSSSSYLNKDDERLRNFQREFFEEYGTIPREEAFLGYDIMRYFGSMTAQYGKNFVGRIDAMPYDVLLGRFEFSRVVREPEKHREQLNYFDQLENKFVHILKFQDYHFQPAETP
ncbi:MAG: hypothetical protein CMN32_04645 [Saprospirales bacterium]|nr:hypothetical protein [Saprospirales bacterium]